MVHVRCLLHDQEGWTPLRWAAGKGLLEVARLLVEKGASLDLATKVSAVAVGRIDDAAW